MYCYKCGKQIPDDAEYCNWCGIKVPSVVIDEETIEDDRSITNKDSTFDENENSYLEEFFENKETIIRKEPLSIENNAISPKEPIKERSKVSKVLNSIALFIFTVIFMPLIASFISSLIIFPFLSLFEIKSEVVIYICLFIMLSLCFFFLHWLNVKLISKLHTGKIGLILAYIYLCLSALYNSSIDVTNQIISTIIFIIFATLLLYSMQIKE